MYSTRSGLILGFHGCDLKIRNGIVNQEIKFRKSKNNYDWLGYGAYFWENNHDRALSFAQDLKNHPVYNKQKIETPAVLGATIDLGNCLDLTDTYFLEIVRLSYEVFAESFRLLNEKIPSNKNTSDNNDLRLRFLDCAVIENLHEQFRKEGKPPFDTIRGAFVEGDPLYSGAGINQKNHIQICVRNPNSIKNFFIPRTKSLFIHNMKEL